MEQQVLIPLREALVVSSGASTAPSSRHEIDSSAPQEKEKPEKAKKKYQRKDVYMKKIICHLRGHCYQPFKKAYGYANKRKL